MRITEANKAVVSGIATIANVLFAAMGDNVIDMTEREHLIASVVSLAVGIYLVWRVPNARPTEDAADEG